jgi:hypothetical protein
MLKIHVDMNAITIDQSRIQLGGILPEDLKPGLYVLLYSPGDFEVEATIEKVCIEGGAEIWFGIVNWDTYRDLPNSEIAE